MRRWIKERAEEKARRREARANTSVPNYICYAWLFPNYDPKTGRGAPSPLPKCRVCCEAFLHPQEHHKCEGLPTAHTRQLQAS